MVCEIAGNCLFPHCTFCSRLSIDANIMVEGGKVSGIIDFGDSVERYDG